jgi:hypothetical protein
MRFTLKRKRDRRTAARLHAAVLAASLIGSPLAFAAEQSQQAHQGHAVPVSGPVAGSNWQEP